MSEKKSWLGFYGSLALAVAVPIIVLRMLKSVYYSKIDKYSFKQKVVVITGASSGIGEALAHEFYKLGCKVVLCARRRDELERVRRELLQTHSTGPVFPPVIMPIDLSDVASLEGVVTKIMEITGHIDLLINNGGISNRGSVIDTSNEVFHKVMTVNYFGTLALTKAVLPYMIKRKRGHIVFVSSIQGLIAIPYRAAYSASKHALQAFSDSLRAEVAKYNINITVVSPGYVHTSLSLNALNESGGLHGQMDKATEEGYSTDYVAKRVATAVAQKQKEIVLAPMLHRFVVLLRTNMPLLYFIIMALRARREKV